MQCQKALGKTVLLTQYLGSVGVSVPVDPGESTPVNPYTVGMYRGDVVVSRSVLDPNQLVCKRLRALEGDIVIGYESSLTPWYNKKVCRIICGLVDDGTFSVIITCAWHWVYMQWETVLFITVKVD